VIATAAGAGKNFGAADGWRRSFKVFVRHDTDLLQIRNDLERFLLQSDDRVIYLQSDLCRADLRVEIDAVLTKDAAHTPA
jgi:chorismate lyase/3-hydroxybenzoate synthase